MATYTYQSIVFTTSHALLTSLCKSTFYSYNKEHDMLKNSMMNVIAKTIQQMTPLHTVHNNPQNSRLFPIFGYRLLKVGSYIAQYPVVGIVQSVVHFTSSQTYSFQHDFSGKHTATLQLRSENYSFTYPPM